MSTHYIQFCDKIRKLSKISVFLSNQRNSIGTQKLARISHSKRVIGGRAFDV